MVTFSVGGSDDGEGPSNPNQKRRRVHDQEQPAYNTEDEENQLSYESQEGFEMENSPFGTLENDAIEGTSSGSNSRQANDMCKTVSAVISDPDVLDCFICSEPLSIPIFQVSFCFIPVFLFDSGMFIWTLNFQFFVLMIVYLCINFGLFFSCVN
jgi:E3 ubiquitin-protein ligase SIAH1